MIRFAIIQITGCALLIAASLQGLLDPLWDGDLSAYWSLAMIAFALCGLCAAAKGRLGACDYVAGELIKLGLLGTVVGLGIAIAGNTGDDYALRDMGVATAVQTTIVGLVSNIWLNLTMRLLGMK